ncbi:DapH/DapD/GlmU-related protein [uncultured Desulfobulbus sp.]|uniref:acyltransferase n=1 Tax=uncultured Desulfobulbus sp. TaxID=239745 RepID=UPI0029C863D6|nr:DapH/DapD/GlmU-related protein [uncultured Desulfobulbus sp.]
MTRLKKYIFRMCYMTVRFLPESCYSIRWIGILSKRIRVFFASRFLAKCGKNVNIETRSIFGFQVEIGDYSGIGVRAKLIGPVIIGKYVNMGPDVLIHTRNHKTDDPTIIMQKQGFDVVKPVTIEDDVWIGERVIILPGVTIGQGSVIGAGAVVAKSIPPYSVAVGNPARVVKSRLKENTIIGDAQSE